MKKTFCDMCKREINEDVEDYFTLKYTVQQLEGKELCRECSITRYNAHLALDERLFGIKLRNEINEA